MHRKKLSRKAAWSLAMVASLILALIFTGIGIQVIQRVGKEVSYGFDKGLCKESVIMNAKFRLPYEEVEQFELQCPTRYIKIGKEMITLETAASKYEVPLRGIRDLSDRDETAKFFNIVNPIMADIIFDCWDQFAAGQLPVLSMHEDDRKQCIVCSRISFDEEVQGSLGGDYWTGMETETSLEEYMATHSPKSASAGGKIGQRKITYLEFTLDPVDAFVRLPYEYSVSEPMAVVFSAVNEYSVTAAIWETITADDESKSFANTLDFVPYAEVKNECDILR